ncbi:MAG: hypothetical protein LBD10_07835 [Desulfobulbus sp.]|jgi:hypothetical protein|uniref:hypothetical protein n=1 Tax=Desulfobulbus sp. TaxID=895 RepID=UPI002850CCB7|nr:hypothetical protein [Desulfobulbus sp.]MDR2550090.1 hypothetical protein [Desulfobulbus sp.]
MGEKRRHPRLAVRDMSIDVSDGMRCCSGIVQDVSQTGLCLADMTSRFGKHIDVYTVVATSGHRFFKFRVRPKWEEASGLNKRMGVEIKEPTGAWLEYVQSLEIQNASQAS